MKRVSILLCILCLILCGCGAQTTDARGGEKEYISIKKGTTLPGSFYTNATVDSAADPFILYADGKYYLYSTGNKSIAVRTSLDLCVFEKSETPAMTLSDFPWLVDRSWAPEVYAYNGYYYMIFSAMTNTGSFSINIGRSASPLGPFRPMNDAPFFAPPYSVIDASLLFDGGRVYLYYSKDCSENIIGGVHISQTYGVEVNADLSGTVGEPVLLSTPEQPWEKQDSKWQWNEGPVVIAKDGKYYLFYSANYYQTKYYSVGYAVADAPLGTYVKPQNNCILAGNGVDVTGTGHCNYFYSPDGTELYMCYHRHTVAPNTDFGRSFCFDRLILEDGKAYVDGPSTTKRPLPGGTNHYFKHTSDITVRPEGDAVADGSTDSLFDGKIEHVKDALLLNSGGTLHFEPAAPQTFYSVWLYTDCAAAGQMPTAYSLVINDTYEIAGKVTSTMVDGAPTIIFLANLPDGTVISDFALTLTAEDAAAPLTLSEVVFVSKE